MRYRHVAIIALVTGLVGCGLLQKLRGLGQEAGADGEVGVATETADAASAEQADSGAAPSYANEKAVKRFADEETVAAEESATEWPTTTLRTEPGTGSAVASLPKGTKCTKVAQRGHSALVSFADPKDAARTLLGWVSADAFVAGTTPPPATLNLGAGGAKKTTGVCPAGLTLLVDGDAFCAKTCKVDKDCKSVGTGLLCQGRAKPIVADGLGAPVAICVKAKPIAKPNPSGPAPTTDAGARPADAGASRPADPGMPRTTTSDAGRPRPIVRVPG